MNTTTQTSKRTRSTVHAVQVLRSSGQRLWTQWGDYCAYWPKIGIVLSCFFRIILCLLRSPILIMKHHRNSQSKRVRWFKMIRHGPFNRFKSPHILTLTPNTTSVQINNTIVTWLDAWQPCDNIPNRACNIMVDGPHDSITWCRNSDQLKCARMWHT